MEYRKKCLRIKKLTIVVRSSSFFQGKQPIFMPICIWWCMAPIEWMKFVSAKMLSPHERYCKGRYLWLKEWIFFVFMRMANKDPKKAFEQSGYRFPKTKTFVDMKIEVNIFWKNWKVILHSSQRPLQGAYRSKSLKNTITCIRIQFCFYLGSVITFCLVDSCAIWRKYI